MFTRGAAARGTRSHDPPLVSERLALAPGAEVSPPLGTPAANGMPPDHEPARVAAVAEKAETLTSGTPHALDILPTSPPCHRTHVSFVTAS